MSSLLAGEIPVAAKNKAKRSEQDRQHSQQLLDRMRDAQSEEERLKFAEELCRFIFNEKEPE